MSLQASDIDEHAPVQIVSCGMPNIVVPLKTLDALRRASIRLDLIDSPIAVADCREVLVFTRDTEGSDADVHCRFFAPRYGIVEDAATGSAHGPLGCYLVKYGIHDGTRIISRQGVEMGRPSTIDVRIRSQDAEITDVLVGGECVEVGAGAILDT